MKKTKWNAPKTFCNLLCTLQIARRELDDEASGLLCSEWLKILTEWTYQVRGESALGQRITACDQN